MSDALATIIVLLFMGMLIGVPIYTWILADRKGENQVKWTFFSLLAVFGGFMLFLGPISSALVYYWAVYKKLDDMPDWQDKLAAEKQKKETMDAFVAKATASVNNDAARFAQYMKVGTPDDNLWV